MPRTHPTKTILRILPSLILFFVGVGAMYIANILITRYSSVEVTAQWATLNSFMMVGGTCALFGFDQQLVREPQAGKLIGKTAIFNVTIAACLAALLGYKLGYITHVYIGVAVVMGFAVSSLTFNWWRSNMRMTAAYIAHGTWRLAFFLGVLFLFITGKATLPAVLVGAFALAAIVITVQFLTLKTHEDLTSIHSDIKRVKDIYIIGSSYFMAALSLAIASYGESLVVRTIGTSGDVALYFKSLVLFLFPGVMFNQYVAAVVGPIIRQDEARTIKILRKYKLWIILGLILIMPGLLAGGFILSLIFYDEIFTPIALAALLSLTACIRLLYILPSNFVGITANKKQLRLISAAYLGFALAFPLMAWGFSKLGLAVIFAVAIANLINWLLRCGAGLSIVRQRFALYPS